MPQPLGPCLTRRCIGSGYLKMPGLLRESCVLNWFQVLLEWRGCAIYVRVCKSKPRNPVMPGFVKQTLKRPAARELTMQDMRDALVVLLAGGQGGRFWPLPRGCAKTAVPFG